MFSMINDSVFQVSTITTLEIKQICDILLFCRTFQNESCDVNDVILDQVTLKLSYHL